MSTKAAVKKIAPKSVIKKTIIKEEPNPILVKKRESILLKELTLLEKNMANYKAERKVSWKSFKSKMETDLSKIRNSIKELSQSEE